MQIRSNHAKYIYDVSARFKTEYMFQKYYFFLFVGQSRAVKSYVFVEMVHFKLGTLIKVANLKKKKRINIIAS